MKEKDFEMLDDIERTLDRVTRQNKKLLDLLDFWRTRALNSQAKLAKMRRQTERKRK